MYFTWIIYTPIKLTATSLAFQIFHDISLQRLQPCQIFERETCRLLCSQRVPSAWHSSFFLATICSFCEQSLWWHRNKYVQVLRASFTRQLYSQFAASPPPRYSNRFAIYFLVYKFVLTRKIKILHIIIEEAWGRMKGFSPQFLCWKQSSTTVCNFLYFSQ